MEMDTWECLNAFRCQALDLESPAAKVGGLGRIRGRVVGSPLALEPPLKDAP